MERRGEVAEKGKPKPREKLKQITVRLPDELHRKMKAKCALEGKAIGEVFIELVRKYVEG
jgi:predicted HicB family RNase H-like nuclease